MNEQQSFLLADVICKTAVLNVSLRDFFAAFALAGLANHYSQAGTSFADVIGPMAYELADAVLAHRDCPLDAKCFHYCRDHHERICLHQLAHREGEKS